LNGACICPSENCQSQPIQAVCGRNEVTYMNTCELKEASCNKQEVISVQYLGKCSESLNVTVVIFIVDSRQSLAMLTVDFRVKVKM
jgi:hypothetical protein